MSNIGLVFDASSFDNFNKSLEKFKKVSVDVDIRLEKIAIATRSIDDKKVSKLSISFIKLSESIDVLNKKVNLKSLEGLYNVFEKIGSLNTANSIDNLAKSLKELSSLSEIKVDLPVLSFFNKMIDLFQKFETIDTNKFSTIKNNLNDFLSIFTGEYQDVNALKAVGDLQKSGIGIKSFFGNIKDAFSGNFGGLQNDAGKIFGIIGDFLGRSEGVFGRLNKSSFSNVAKIEGIVKSISRLFEQLRNLQKIDIDPSKLKNGIQALNDLTVAFTGRSGVEKIQDTFGNFINFFKSGEGGISEASQLGKQFLSNGLSFSGILNSVGSLFKSSIFSGTGGFFDIFNNNSIIERFGGFSEKQAQAFRIFANSSRDLVLALNTLISIDIDATDPEKIRNFFQKFALLKQSLVDITSLFTGGSFVDKFISIFSGIKTGDFVGVFRNISGLFGNNSLIEQLSKFSLVNLSGFSSFTKSLSVFIRAINEFGNSRFDEASLQNLKDAISGIVDLFVSGESKFFGLIKSQGILSKISSLNPKSLSKLADFLTPISGLIRSLKMNSNMFFDEGLLNKLADSLEQSFDKFANLSKKIGKLDTKSFQQFIKSISDILNAGLKQNIPNLKMSGLDEAFYNQGVSSAKAQIDAYEDTFEISSPSKVMARIGEFIVQGLFQGISKTITGKLNQFGNYIKNSLINILTSAFTNVSMIIGTALINTFRNIFNILIEKSGIKVLINNIKGGFDFITNKILIPFSKKFIDVVGKIWSFVPKRTLAVVGVLGLAISQIPNIIAGQAIFAINSAIGNLIASLGVPSFIGFLFADAIRNALIQNFPAIVEAAKFVFNGIIKVWNAISPVLGKAFKFVFDNIGKIIKLSLDIAGKAIKFFLTSTVNGLRLIERVVRGVLTKSFQFIGNVIKGTAQIAKNFFNILSPSNIINGLERLGQRLFYIRQVFDNLYNAAKRFYDLTIGVSVAFESAFTGVLKTLSIPPEILAQGEEAVAAFEQSIRDTINTMATAPDSLLSGLDNAFVTLSGIAENAGALGIAGDQVAEFTEVVGQLTLATDLTADAASSFIAIFSTVTGNQSFQQLGGAITALGNQSAATESQIAEISQRIVGVGNAAGLSEDQILGWGAAIRSLGIEAELGGTAFNTLVTEITSSTAQGGAELNQFAELAGLSAVEFVEAWETDASGALQSVIEGLGELDNASRIQVLDNLGLDGARMTQFISLISSNTEELNRILGVAEENFVVFGDSVEDFNALQEETARRSATTASNLARVANVAKGLGDIIGQFFLPAFNEALTNISLTLSDFGGILTENREVIQEVIDSVTGSVGFLLEAFGNLFNAVMQFFSVFTGGQNPVLFFFSRLGDFIKFISFQILQFAKAIDSVATRISSVSGAMLNILGFGLDTNLDGMKKVSDEYGLLADGIETVNALLGEQNTTLPQTTDYLIEQGDTLSEIATQYGVTVDEIAKLNNIENPNLIIAGTTIQIPSSTVQGLQSAADSTTIITENIDAISTTVDQTLRDMTKLFEPTTLEDFKQVALDILNEFNNIGTELTNIKNNFDGLMANFNPANARKFGASLGNSLGNIAKSFGSILANLFGGTGNIEFSPVFTNIRDSFYAILEGLFNLPEGELNRIITPFVTELFSFIGNIFNLLITAGSGGDISESFAAIQENISNAASGLTIVFIEAIRGAFENLPELIRTGAGAAAAIIGAFVGIATAIIDGIGEAFNQLSEEEKMQLAGQLVTVLIAVAGLMATVGAITGLGSAVLGAIAAGLTALGVSGVAIVALAIALGAAMVAAIVSPEFREELGTALEDTVDSMFGEGTYDNFQMSIQTALTDAGIAAGNTILAFMDDLKAQALFLIENLANGFADILEAAHLTDQANALRESVAVVGAEADVLTLQADIRTGTNPTLTNLLDVFSRGQALGLEVDVIAGEIDERVQELLTIAGNQGTTGVSNEISVLLDMGVSLETINANLQTLGISPEDMETITNNLIASGDLTLEQVPIFIEGFDIQIPEANLANTIGDAQANVLSAIGLGSVNDADAVQMFVDGELTFEELTVVLPDEETRNAAIQTAFDTAASTGDLFTLQYLTLTATEFDIQLNSESLISAIETGALSSEDIIEISPSLQIGFENAAFSFTSEQIERLTTELSEAAITNIDMSGVGGELINGIIDGIEAENPELVESITNSAQGVLDEFDNIWRIESPSQEMIEKGQFLMQGLSIGMQIGYLLVNEAFMMIINSQLMLEEETLLHIERMTESYEEFADLMKDISSKITKYIQNMAKETIKAFSSMVSASSALRYNLTNNLIALKPILDATTTEIYELGDAFYFVVLKAAQAQVVMNNAINQANSAILNGGTSGGSGSSDGSEGQSAVGGGRKFGGDVFAGNIYEILEGNLPFEIFKANNRTFFLPNVGGKMISPFGNNTASMFQPQMDSRINNSYGGNSTVINVPVQIDGISGDVSDARIDEISERITKNVSAGLNTANNQESLTRRLNRRGKS